MFFEIKGRVVSTFENPNVLGEFLILVFPITLALMAAANHSYERFFLFAISLLNGWCLIFTWSRGAWIGCIIATALFLCVSSKYFFTAGLLSLPCVGAAVYWKHDSLILSRLTDLPIIPLVIICMRLELGTCAIGFFMLRSGKWAKRLV